MKQLKFIKSLTVYLNNLKFKFVLYFRKWKEKITQLLFYPGYTTNTSILFQIIKKIMPTGKCQ